MVQVMNLLSCFITSLTVGQLPFVSCRTPSGLHIILGLVTYSSKIASLLGNRTIFCSPLLNKNCLSHVEDVEEIAMSLLPQQRLTEKGIDLDPGQPQLEQDLEPRYEEPE